MNQRRDLVVILFLFGLLLLCSPLTLWWMQHIQLWYLPYILWALVIALTALLNIKPSR